MGRDGEDVHRVRPLHRGWGLSVLGKTGFGVLPFGCIFTPKGEPAAGSPRTLQPAFPSRETRISQPKSRIFFPLFPPQPGTPGQKGTERSPAERPPPQNHGTPATPAVTGTLPGPSRRPRGLTALPEPCTPAPRWQPAPPAPQRSPGARRGRAPGSPRPPGPGPRPGPAPGRAGRGGGGFGSARQSSAPLGQGRAEGAAARMRSGRCEAEASEAR